MRCTSCGFQSPEGTRFCGGCGAPFARSCPRCGAASPPEFRFCGSCGAGLASPSPEGRPVPAPRDPRSYTPKHLRERILAARSALEGERKQVTVLFADVKGSMDLAQATDVEEWHSILDGLFQILADGNHRFEGTVNQYTGDGIMALFGAPIAHEDHAQRACYAALHLRDALRRYADQLRLTRGLDLSVRMGIHSGEVVVGKIGDDLRMDYTAQGSVVGLAARLQEVAGADRACMSEDTAAVVRGYFALRDLGQANLKGVAGPLRVFELEGRGELRSRFDLSRSRGLSKFVGRGRELEALEAALESALAGRGQVVGVVAEAGAGKSRLCFELFERCRARGLLVRTAAGVSHGRNVPLLPVLDFYRASFGIEERDDARTARQKIAGSVVRLDESLLPSLPLLDDFLGVPDPERPLSLPDGPERQRALLALVKHLTLARSRREPAVILFEDLHWLDPASETFLESLVDAVDGNRTLLVVNFRPEYRAAWMGRSYYQQLALAPLDERAFEEMLSSLLGRDASLAGLAARIHARTGGNPFFAEELLRDLVESGALEGAAGAYRLAREAPTLTLPATVHAVLAARIDRLAEREKEVLQTASVIGREFAESLLARVAAINPEALAEALRGLVRAELLLEAALYPETEYAFKHPLTQEVAYGSQLRERRARVHEAVGKALAELHADQLDERAALLAHHSEGAGDPVSAARWHHRAGHWLEDRDPHAARAHYERVLEMSASQSASVERERHRLEAAARLLNLAFYLGLAPERARELYLEGRDAAARLTEPELEALLVAFYAQFATFAGGDAGLVSELESAALRLAPHVRDPLLYSEVVLSATTYRLNSGRVSEAIEFLDRSVAPLVASPEVDPRLVARFHGMRGRLLAEAGRFAEASGAFDRAVASAGRVPEHDKVHRFLEGMQRILFRLRGDSDKLELLARGVARADERSIHFARVNTRYSLAELLLVAGREDEALAVVREAIAIARETSANLFLIPVLEVLEARALLLRGDVAGAERVAAETIPPTTWSGLVRLRLLRARLGIARDAPGERSEIESSLDEIALDIAAAGLDAYAPEVHEVRADLARALGDEPGRERALREAHRLCADMGADGLAARLARLLGDAGRRAE